MNFSLEPYSDSFAREALPLNRDHHNEVSAFQDIRLEPDYAQYEAFGKSGMLRIFTVREEGALMGYSIFFVRSAPHYKGSIQAAQDILYLDPKLRAGLNGYKFIAWVDDQLRAEGVQVVYQSTTCHGKDFGKVLMRLGYEPLENLYARRLDR